MSTADIMIGAARVFYAPVGEELPADSLEYGGMWTGNWDEIALTKEALSMKRDASDYDVRVEQSTLPIRRVTTEEDVTFETTLAEFTGDYLALAMEGTNTATAAGAGQVGKEELVAGGEYFLTERTWAFEGMYVDASGNQFPVRIQIYRATSVLNGELKFTKSEEVGIPLEIKALGDLTKSVGAQVMTMQRVLAEATS